MLCVCMCSLGWEVLKTYCEEENGELVLEVSALKLFVLKLLSLENDHVTRLNASTVDDSAARGELACGCTGGDCVFASVRQEWLMESPMWWHRFSGIELRLLGVDSRATNSAWKMNVRNIATPMMQNVKKHAASSQGTHTTHFSHAR